MKSDRELLESAAKAYGDKSVIESPLGFERIIGYSDVMQCDVMVQWNPITDDGDALRLAVKLGMSVCVDNEGGLTRIRDEYMELILVCRHEPKGADAATRMAIVRVAASIGDAMP